MAQRANSPTRGTTKLAAYDTKIRGNKSAFFVGVRRVVRVFVAISSHETPVQEYRKGKKVTSKSSSFRGALHPSLGRNRSPYTSKIK